MRGVSCILRVIISVGKSLIAQTFIILDTWWWNHLWAVNILVNLRLNRMLSICIEKCRR